MDKPNIQKIMGSHIESLSALIDEDSSIPEVQGSLDAFYRSYFSLSTYILQGSGTQGRRRRSLKMSEEREMVKAQFLATAVIGKYTLDLPNFQDLYKRNALSDILLGTLSQLYLMSDL